MADPVTFTTEQELPLSFKIVDGRGRAVPVDGVPVVASSDETVATVSSPEQQPDGSYTTKITAVSASPDGTTQRISITADADVSPAVDNVVGTLDFTVTLDPRTAARTIQLVPGAPVDKAA